jgi:hypothetical protein
VAYDLRSNGSSPPLRLDSEEWCAGTFFQRTGPFGLAVSLGKAAGRIRRCRKCSRDGLQDGPPPDRRW